LRIIAATYNKKGLIMCKHTTMRMCGVLLASSLAAGCGEDESGLDPMLDPATIGTESPLSLPKRVIGDRNADFRSDIALTGGFSPNGQPWSSVPIAFSNGDGSFNVTNLAIADFGTFATQTGAQPVSGDFDGDGRTDIALTGGFQSNGQPWGSVPVAFSNGDGSFRVTNLAITNFATFATQTGAKPVSGDFDGDGRGDIALTGGLSPGC